MRLHVRGNLWAKVVLARGAIAGRRAELLTGLVVSALATCLLVAGVSAVRGTAGSLRIQERELGTPRLLVKAPLADAQAISTALAETSGVAKVGAGVSMAQGTVVNGVTAPVLIATGDGELPPWVDLVTGRAPSPDKDEVALEGGVADTLHLHVGQSVRLGGPHGSTMVRVVGIAYDMSQPRYPLSSPGIVYSSTAAGARLGLPSTSAKRIFGVWLDSSADPATISHAFLAAVPSGHAAQMSRIDSARRSVSLITGLVIDVILGLGILAFLCLLLFLAAGARVEVLRRERWIGELRSTGWRVSQIRQSITMSRWPAVGIGTAGGAVCGVFAGRALTSRITQLYGVQAHAVNAVSAPLGIVMAVVIFSSCAMWFATRRLRSTWPAAQLSGSADRARGPQNFVCDLRVGGVALRLGAAMAMARLARSVTCMIAVGLAVFAGIFAAATSASLTKLTSDPTQWGYSYQLRVDLPAGASADQAALQIGRLAGVAEAAASVEGNVTVPSLTSTVAFECLPVGEKVVAPKLLAGRMPAADNEAVIGSGLAAELHANVGASLTLGRGANPISVTIVGITREFGDQGKLLRGTLGLAALLPDRRTSEAVLVRATRGVSATSVLQQLRELSAGRWSITDVTTAVRLPFASTMHAAIGALALAVIVLAAATALYIGLVTAEQMVPNQALLQAVGASRRQLVSVAATFTAATVLPGALAGIVAGRVLSPVALDAVTSEFGGIDVSMPTGMISSVVAVAVAVPSAGILLSLLRTLPRRTSVALGVRV